MQVTPETKSKNHNDVKPEQLLLKSHAAMGARIEGQMGSADPLEKGMKKRKHAKKQQFTEYFESNQGRQV